MTQGEFHYRTDLPVRTGGGLVGPVLLCFESLNTDSDSKS